MAEPLNNGPAGSLVHPSLEKHVHYVSESTLDPHVCWEKPGDKNKELSRRTSGMTSFGELQIPHYFPGCRGY